MKRKNCVKIIRFVFLFNYFSLLLLFISSQVYLPKPLVTIDAQGDANSLEVEFWIEVLILLSDSPLLFLTSLPDKAHPLV